MASSVTDVGKRMVDEEDGDLVGVVPHETGSLSEPEPSHATTSLRYRRSREQSTLTFLKERERAASQDSAAPSAETELARMRGVVLGRNEELATVRVEFREPNLIVDFPTAVFSNPALARYGSVVDYVVRQRSDGFRYQTFLASETREDNPILPKLQRLLSVIED